MDAAKAVTEPLNGFVVDSVRLLRRCNKPDRKGEFACEDHKDVCGQLVNEGLTVL